MKDLFLLVAPYTTLLFVVALPVEIFVNYKNSKYASGAMGAWLMRITAYTIFGIYEMLIGEYVVGSIQFLALTFSLVICIQRYLYQSPRYFTKN